MIIGVNFIPTKGHCNQEIVLFGDSLMSGYELDQEFHLSSEAAAEAAEPKPEDVSVDAKTQETVAEAKGEA